MRNYKLKEVTNRQDIKAFLEMPLSIYRDEPNWIRPWDHDIENVFSPVKNALFNGGEAIRWIAYNDKNESVGRIAAFYNNDLVAKEEIPTGGCGFFESIDDKEVAFLLFDTAREWLTKRGMKAMDGPINFGTRDYFWGVLVEGYYPPMYNMNYNKPYYKDLFEAYGFQNYFNQHTYVKEISSAKTNVNNVVVEKAQRLREAGYKFRHITKADYPTLGDSFRTIYNKAWSKFSGVAAMTKEHSDKLFKELKPIIDNKLIYFAYHESQVIGFFIMVPNIYEAIKHLNGKFNFWAKLKFMYHLKVKKSCTTINALVFGVNPDYQGKGVESGMINAVREHIGDTKRYTHMELVWIGDFNPLMMRMVESYVQAQKYKMHTTYRYMIDKSIEFKRCPKVSVARKSSE